MYILLLLIGNISVFNSYISHKMCFKVSKLAVLLSIKSLIISIVWNTRPISIEASAAIAIGKTTIFGLGAPHNNTKMADD